MKLLFALLLAAISAATLSAQIRLQNGTQLTAEEVQLIDAFRANPAPFRALLAGQAPIAVAGGTQGSQFVGPRDVIDVSVSGGKIAFYGKRGDYEPTSIRLMRGEEAVIEFTKHKSTTVSKVKVGFRSDGLHFDVPRTVNNRTTPERGLIVIPEDQRWRSGEPIRYEGPLDNWRSVSEAQGVEFRIRYISAR